MRRTQGEQSWRDHNRIRIIVLHDKPEAALGLVETLGFVDLLPLLAVTPEHAERLADCDVEGILRLQSGAAELSLEDTGRPLLRRWSLNGQSDIQIALTVRDLMLKAGRRRSMVWGPLEIHPRLFRASWLGKPLQLSPLQLRLMTLLVAAEGEVVTRQQIAARVFGDSFDRSGDRLDAHVRRLRQLLEEDPAHPRFLLTVRGEGLRLGDVSEESDPPSASASL
ncbi:winged helix-turn-helix domain-containing protein [Kribbella sp. NPDC023855]|uniref:winged helix-turn-helix domain-containing protein n=1 Tax=Kribbella sp. NPDC023855 TaxID=3154698 RepID=UPI0033C91F1B